jgi:hypothetical protein
MTSFTSTDYSNAGSPSIFTIPSSFTSIGNDAFNGVTNLTSITIPNSITSIGKDAFRDATNLSTVTFDDISNSQLTTLDYGAFNNVTSLTSITIPASVTEIYDRVFMGTTNLTEVIFHDISNSQLTEIYGATGNGPYNEYGDSVWNGGAFRDSGLTTIIIPNNVQKIGRNAFRDTTNLSSVTIEPGTQITVLDYGAFKGATSLTSIIIPKSVLITSQWKSTNLFQGCSNLTNVTFEEPASVKHISRDMFRDAGLTSIIIPTSVTDIAVTAFKDTIDLTLVIFESDSSLSTIGTTAFIGSGLTTVYADQQLITSQSWSTTSSNSIGGKDGVEVKLPHFTSIDYTNAGSPAHFTIPSYFTTIEDNAFLNLTTLTSITIPNTITSIGNYAFKQTTNLDTVIFEANSILETIGVASFQNLTKLTSIHIPNSVTSIEQYAFDNTRSLVSVTFESGSSLLTIGKKAFRYLVDLPSITIPYSVTTMGSEVFQRNYDLKNVTFGSGSALTSGGNNMFFQAGVENIYADSTLISRMGWSVGTQILPWCTAASCPDIEIISTTFSTSDYTNAGSPATLTIPSPFTSIANYAFRNLTTLTSITIPNTITSIGNYAFKQTTNLDTVIFEANSILRTIGVGSFQNLTKLTSIHIPNSVTSIGDTAFDNVQSLVSVTFESGSSLLTIGNNAFKRCSITPSITIPSSVTSIGDTAFYDIPELKMITFEPGSTINTFGTNAFISTNLKIVVADANLIAINSWSTTFTNTIGGKTGITVITPDSTAPTITGTAITPGNSTATVTFSEPVFNAIGGSEALQPSDFSLSINGGSVTVAATPSSISISGNVYTLGLTLTGIAIGTEVLTIVPSSETAIYDIAGNTASTIQSNNTVTLFDGILPTITGTTIGQNNSTVTVTFSEPVFNTTGGSGALEPSDFSLSINGGSFTAVVSSISISGNAYTLGLTLSGIPTGTEVLTIVPSSATAIYDTVGNAASTTQSTNTVTLIEGIVPIITGTTIAPDNSTVTVTFSEPVFNTTGGSGALEPNDFSLSINGGSATVAATPSIISISGNAYTLGLTLTGTPRGTEVLTIVPSSATAIYDAVGNAASTAQPNNTVTLIDETAPTITGTTIGQNNSTLTVTLSEPVFNTTGGSGALEPSDFSLSINGGAVTAVVASDISISGNAYTLGLTLTGTPTGTEVLTIVPSSATAIYDATGNAASTTQSNNTVTLIEGIVPIITGTTIGQNNSTLTVTFSEPVFNATGGSGALEPSDFSLSTNGGSVTAVVVSSVSISGNVCTLGLTLTGIPTGTEVLTIVPSSATAIYDAAGNAVSTTQSNNTVTLTEGILPTITATTIGQNNSTVTVTFSEPVFNATGGSGALEVSDFSLSINGGAVTAVVASDISISGNAYTLGLTLTGTPTGTEVLTIVPSSATAIYDAAGNAASTTQSNNIVTLIDMSTFRSSHYINAGSPANCTIPNGFLTIGDNAFRDATSLTSITIPNSVTSIGKSAFHNTSLYSVKIPFSVTIIDSYAFKDTTNLTSLTLAYGATGSNLTTMGTDAFVNSGLTTAAVETSKQNIFTSNSNWPQNVTFNVINISVLRNSRLNEINFLNDDDYNTISGTKEFNITNIQNADAYIDVSNNNGLYDVAINTIGTDTITYTFTHNGAIIYNGTIHISISGVTINRDNKNQYSSRYIDLSGNSVLTISKHVNIIESSTFINDETINILYFNFKIDNIRTAAFRSASNLHTIIFNNGVDVIGDSVFYFTNVSKIINMNTTYFINGNTLEIPTNTIVIGGIFQSHTHFYSDSSNNIVMPSSAFIYKNLTTLKLPVSLITIKMGCLRYSKIKSLVLPRNLELIEFHAFYGNNIENLFVSNSLSNVFYGSFNVNIIQNYYVYDNPSRTVYLGNLQELAGDYEPLVLATNIVTKFTDIVGVIIQRELFIYSDYISSLSKLYNYLTVEDTLLTINIRDITNISTVNGSTITMIEPPRGNFSFNDPYAYFTPELNSNITDAFIYEERYNNDQFELVTVNIDIIPVDDVPVSYNVDISMNEDTNIQIDFSYNDVDTHINDLSYNILSQPNSGILSNIDNNKLAILYTPDNNFFGDVSFTYSISDLQIGSNISTVNIQVIHVNEPPVVYDISKEIIQNSIGFTQSITYNDIDSSNDLFTYHIYNPPTNGIATFNNNVLNYVPNPDHYGVDILQYYVIDGDLSSNIGNINITILEQSFFPQVVDLKIQTIENEPVNINLDIIYGAGNISDLSFIFVSTVQNGSLLKLENQLFVYTPKYHFSGADNFSYYLIAPDGNQSIVASVNINVLKTQYAGCIYCPPKVIFERNNNTYFNASGKIHMAHRNIRNEGKGCNTFVSQPPSIIVPPKNKF